ncbi:hypothetical protein [Enterobacter hormaechei]|uniref:hypothetical protein n=1 Tax=Enterobacter hormaechei TaxID=158836 RepID=UPI002FFC3319
MSTITKEWILKTIAELEEERDAVPGVVNEDAVMALEAMKLAMASLEAEPISVQDERYQHLSEIYHAQEKRLFKLVQRIKGESFDKYSHSPSQAIDVLESAIFGESAEEDSRASMLQGAEHVTTAYKLPEGWVAVPVEPTKEMIDAGWSYYMTTKSPSSLGVYGAMLAAAPQEDV